MASTGELASARPGHVPPELFWDHDWERFASQDADPFRHVGSLHAGPEIFWCRNIGRNRPGWILTRNAHIREAFADSEHFSSFREDNFLSPIGLDVRMTPLEYDPPEHFHYRKAIEPYFTPAAVNALDGAGVRSATSSWRASSMPVRASSSPSSPSRSPATSSSTSWACRVSGWRISSPGNAR
jgi:cytochrome P450